MRPDLNHRYGDVGPQPSLGWNLIERDLRVGISYVLIARREEAELIKQFGDVMYTETISDECRCLPRAGAGPIEAP